MSTDKPIELVDTGKRIKAVIDGENYYMMVGENSLTITCPYENRDKRLKERHTLDQIAEATTLARGGRID